MLLYVLDLWSICEAAWRMVCCHGVLCEFFMHFSCRFYFEMFYFEMLVMCKGFCMAGRVCKVIFTRVFLMYFSLKKQCPSWFCACLLRIWANYLGSDR
jgi:hypothetical protein